MDTEEKSKLMLADIQMDDRELARLLMNGAVGVLPTDTLYGLVCRASDSAAVSRLYDAKQREAKPGTVIAADIQQLEGLGLSPDSISAAIHYWPGPVSVLLLAGEQLQYITQGKPELACRVVSGPAALIRLLRTTGPLLTTSANSPEQPPANTTQEARRYFGTSVDFYVDGGDMAGNLPSTLVRQTPSGLEVLRTGAGTID